MIVLLGVYDLNNHFEAGRSVFSVQSINMHPDWNPHAESFDADITVLVLESEVVFTTLIQPICLPDSNVTAINKGVVIGYGKSEDETKVHENIPKIIDIPIHRNEDCFLNNYLLAKLSSRRTFCGGTGTGVGVCNGDSGSGMIVTDGTAFYLRAIVSSSLLNANRECNVDTYSVFTDVTKYVDWIEGISTSRFN
jgi:secreted trypsin-like serine protease